MIKFLFKISLFAFALAVPFGVFAAVQSGGGYIINGQVNPVTSFTSGGGYSSQIGGNPISGVISGGSYTTYGGGYFTPPDEIVVTPPSSGGGGGGGSSGGGSTPTPELTSAGAICDTSQTFAQLLAGTPIGYAPCRTDPFPDRVIDVLDFNVLMVNWSRSVGSVTDKRCVDKLLADINCDGAVDILDFNLLMVYWGKPVFVIR